MAVQQTVLVTGGCGYIGSHAVKRLLQDGYRVVVFDNLSRGYRDVIDILEKYGDLEFIEGDLRNRDEVRVVFEQKIDAVMHFAALCLVDESMREPGLYFENNVLGTLNLLEVMRESGVGTLIFSSTCAVYGDAQYLPIDEQHPTQPLNPYGESKLMAERLIEWFSRIHGIRYMILRYFNVCGADTDGEIGDSKKPSQLLVQNAVRGALGIEEFQLTCPRVDTPDGTPIRDYINVEDLVDAHIRAYQYLIDGGESQVCNLGNGRGWSVREIVQAVEEELDVTIPMQEAAKKREGEYAEVYADKKKAEELLGWRCEKTLEESIESLKQWYEKRPEGYN